MKLTEHQRMLLEALARGEMLTIDVHNCMWLGSVHIQPKTRSVFMSRRYLTRLDPSRAATTKGNGFVISDKGRAALTEG